MERKGKSNNTSIKRTSILTDISEDSDTSFDENFDFRGKKRIITKGKYVKKASDIGALSSAVEKKAKLSSDDDLSTSSIENISFPKRRRTIVKNKYLKLPLDLKAVSKAIEAKESSVELSSEDESSIHRFGPRVPRNRAVANKVAIEDFAEAIDKRDVSNSTESEDEKVSRRSSVRDTVAESVPVLNRSLIRKTGLGRIRFHNRERIPMKISDFAANIEQMGNELKERGDSSLESSTSTSAIITPRRPLRPSGDGRSTGSSKVTGNKISIFEQDKIAKDRDRLAKKSSLNADDSNLKEKSIDKFEKVKRVTQQFHVEEILVLTEKLTKSEIEAYTKKKDLSSVSSKPKRSSNTYNDDVLGVLDIVEYSSDANSGESNSRDFIPGTGTLLQTYHSKFQSSPEKTDLEETEMLSQNKSQRESSIINRSLSQVYETTPVKWTPNNVSLRQSRRSSLASPQKSAGNPRRTLSFVIESNVNESSPKKSFGKSKNTSIENVTPHQNLGSDANKTRLSSRNEDEEAAETPSKNRRQSSNTKNSTLKSGSKNSVEFKEADSQSPIFKNATSAEKISPSKFNKRYATRSGSEKDQETSVGANKTLRRRSSGFESNQRHSNRSENAAEPSINKSNSLGAKISPSKSSNTYSTRSEDEKVSEATVISPPSTRRSLSFQVNKRQSTISESEKTADSPVKQISPSKSEKRKSITNTLIKKRHSLDGQTSATKSNLNRRYLTRSEGEKDLQSKLNLTSDQQISTSLSKSRIATENEEAPETPRRILRNRSTSGQNSEWSKTIFGNEEASKSPNKKIAGAQSSPSKSRSRPKSKENLETPTGIKPASDEQILGSKSRNRHSIRNEDEDPKSSINKSKSSETQNIALKSDRRYSTRSDSEKDPETPIKNKQSTGGLNSASKLKNWHPESPAQNSVSKSNSKYSTRSKGEESPISKSQASDELVFGSKSRSRYTIDNDGNEALKSPVNKSRTSDKQISGRNEKSRRSIGNDGEEALKSKVNESRTPDKQLSHSKSRGRSSTKRLEAPSTIRSASKGQISDFTSTSRQSIGNKGEESPESSTNESRTSGKQISGFRHSIGNEGEESPKSPISKSQASSGRISASKSNRDYSSESDSEKDFETPIKKTQAINPGSKSKMRVSARSEDEEIPKSPSSKSQASSRRISASKSNRDYSSESDSEKGFETPNKKTQAINPGSKSKMRASARSEDEASDISFVEPLNVLEKQKQIKTLRNISAEATPSNKGSFEATSSTVRSKKKTSTSLILASKKFLENISPIKTFNTPLHVLTGSSARSPLLSPAYESVTAIQTSTSIKNSPQKKTSNVSKKRSSSNSLTREPEAKKPRLVQATIQVPSRGEALVVSKKMAKSPIKSKLSSTINKPLTSGRAKKKVGPKKQPAKKKDSGYVIPRQYVKYNAERFTRKRLPPETINAIHKASENFLKDTVKNLEERMRTEGRTDFTHKDLLNYLLTIGLFKDKNDWVDWVRKQAPMDIREVLIPCARAGNVVF